MSRLWEVGLGHAFDAPAMESAFIRCKSCGVLVHRPTGMAHEFAGKRPLGTCGEETARLVLLA